VRILALIPAHNEAPRIAAVVAGLRQRGLPVLVVDDGSRDDTTAVARAAGAEVLRQNNAGKGAALIAGCRWACAHGFTRVVCVDGDGQHDPAEVWRLVAAARRGHALVIGSRRLERGCQPLFRRLANRAASLAVTGLAGRRIRDSQSGYRLCDPHLLLRLPLSGRHYDLETECCILTSRAGLGVGEVPVRTIYNNKPSGMHPLVDSMRFLWALVGSAMRCR
jgi:glycosyltransferase involved in cell wall biosynthesis